MQPAFVSKLIRGKAITIQASKGPEFSRRLRLPAFKTVDTGGKPYAPAAITPKEIFRVLISLRS
jgi:hypothetical protein